jgi:uncharacterized RDD family membrane protein YckC
MKFRHRLATICRVDWLFRVMAMAAMIVVGVTSGERAAMAQGEDSPGRVQTGRSVVKRGTGEPILDGQGWLVFAPVDGAKGAGASGRVVLLHLPAREVGGLGESGSEDLEGVVRVACETGGRLAVGGEELAWWRNRAFVAMEPEGLREGVGTGWRVVMLSAVRGVGSFYEYMPPKRFEELTPLPKGEAIVGMAAMSSGPIAMLLRTREGGGGTARPELWVLAGNQWTSTSIPWETSAGESPSVPTWRLEREGGVSHAACSGLMQLLSWRGGFAIAIASLADSEVIVWIARPVDRAGIGRDIEWRRVSYGMRELAGTRLDAIRLAFVEGPRPADDALLAVAFDDSAGSPVSAPQARVYQMRAERAPLLMATVPGVPRHAAVIPMAAPGDSGASSGQLSLAWWEGPSGGESGLETSGLHVREVSALTGRVMYTGSAKVGRHAERPMVQWIVVLALLVGVGLMVCVQSADPRRALKLPAGVVTADPVRRLLAAAMDYVPSAVAVAIMQGRSALVLLMPSTMLGGAEPALGDLDLRPLGLAIAVTIVHTTLCEWLFGRSVGKFVLGVRVVSTRGSAPPDIGPTSVLLMTRPGLGQALVRNLVRWLVPMLAVFGMLDLAGRHPGDMAAGTLVVADPNDGK